MQPQQQGPIFNRPYAVMRKNGRPGYFESLCNIHLPCTYAFLRGESYGRNGDCYMLISFPVISESVYFKQLDCMFHVKGMLLIGIDHFFYVGYFGPCDLVK